MGDYIEPGFLIFLGSRVFQVIFSCACFFTEEFVLFENDRIASVYRVIVQQIFGSN